MQKHQREKLDGPLVARLDQPLIGVPIQDNGHDTVVYFIDDAQADAELHHTTHHRPIKLAGVWHDLDGNEVLDALDRIRHQSRPTPPITDLEPQVSHAAIAPSYAGNY
jgi:hypothetical protein